MTAIRLPQTRVLQALNKFGPLSRKAICKRTNVTIGPINNAIGESDEKCRNAGDKRRGYPSLLNLKMVKYVPGEEDGRECDALAITADGKKALESSLKELEGKLPPVNHNTGHKPYSNAKKETNGEAPKDKPKKPAKAAKEGA